VYRRLLGRAEARALSVAWSADGSIVYGGFADGCIRALEVATGAPQLLLNDCLVQPMLGAVPLRAGACAVLSTTVRRCTCALTVRTMLQC
jgi:hypothetical protein